MTTTEIETAIAEALTTLAAEVSGSVDGDSLAVGDLVMRIEAIAESETVFLTGRLTKAEETVAEAGPFEAGDMDEVAEIVAGIVGLVGGRLRRMSRSNV
jgi:hypothetical protein